MREREDFVRKIAEKNPKKIVDLGCGPGIWLDLIRRHVDPGCNLVGVDSDHEAIVQANLLLNSDGNRKCELLCLDIEEDIESLPKADIFMAFNIFPYIKDMEKFLRLIRGKISENGALVVRQYDGANMRFGPMNQIHRQAIELSLQSALLGSRQFRHYDLDHVYSNIMKSPYKNKFIGFELFERSHPYPEEFIEYFDNSLRWAMNYLGDDASQHLWEWRSKLGTMCDAAPSYFTEVDLVAWLS